jgi:hypothetical protein
MKSKPLERLDLVAFRGMRSIDGQLSIMLHELSIRVNAYPRHPRLNLFFIPIKGSYREFTPRRPEAELRWAGFQAELGNQDDCRHEPGYFAVGRTPSFRLVGYSGER